MTMTSKVKSIYFSAIERVAEISENHSASTGSVTPTVRATRCIQANLHHAAVRSGILSGRPTDVCLLA